MLGSFGLLRDRRFAALWSAGLISFIGGWVLLVGLPIHVFLLTGSALATSGLFAAGAISRVLVGSVAGVYVDRWDRRRTLVIANLLQAVAVLPLLLVNAASEVWVTYVVAAVGTSLTQFVIPAEGALLPKLVAPDQLMPANALNALNNNLARLIGPAVGGIVAGAYGLVGVALVASAAHLAAAALIGTIAADTRPARVGEIEPMTPLRRLWSEWTRGLGAIKGERVLVVVFLLIGLSAVGEGVFGVLYVLFVSKVVGGGAAEIGLFMSCQAIGGLVGAVVVVSISRVASPARLLGLATFAFGLIDLAIFNAPALGASLLTVAGLFVLVGLPAAAIFPAVNALIQTHAEDAYRGRILGALGTTTGVLGLVGIGIAGFLGDRFEVVPILNIQGFAHVVAGVLVVLALRETSRRVTVRSAPTP